MPSASACCPPQPAAAAPRQLKATENAFGVCVSLQTEGLLELMFREESMAGRDWVIPVDALECLERPGEITAVEGPQREDHRQEAHALSAAQAPEPLRSVTLSRARTRFTWVLVHMAAAHAGTGLPMEAGAAGHGRLGDPGVRGSTRQPPGRIAQPKAAILRLPVVAIARATRLTRADSATVVPVRARRAAFSASGSAPSGASPWNARRTVPYPTPVKLAIARKL